MKMKNNKPGVYKNKTSVPVANPRGEVSQKRADLKKKAEVQKEVVEQDLGKIKKDARTVLLMAGAAFVTFQVVRALTKDKKPVNKDTPDPVPAKKTNPVNPITSAPTEKDGLGKVVFTWIKNEVVSYAAGKIKDLVYNYVQSRINKQQNVEEDTANTHSEKETRD